MRAIDIAEIVLFMYSKSHTFITNYKTDWTIREINYAQEEGKSIVFLNIDGTPLSQWFKFMFPQQQQVDATSNWALTKLIEDIKQKIGKTSSEQENHLAINNELYREKYINGYTDGLEYDYDEIKHTASITRRWRNRYYFSEVSIPPTIKHGRLNYRITSIADSAFYECKELNSIQIPQTVTSIGECAFGNCNRLEFITLPDKITSIRESVFFKCESLRIINLPDNITSIGNSAFYSCRNLQRIVIPQDVNTIGGHAFSNCTHLESVTLPKKITSIRESVFSKCESLSSIIIPNGVVYIGEFAFENCTKLVSVKFPQSIRRIGRCAFKGCTNLKSVILPKDIIHFPEDAFPISCTIIRK